MSELLAYEPFNFFVESLKMKLNLSDEQIGLLDERYDVKNQLRVEQIKLGTYQEMLNLINEYKNSALSLPQ